MKLARLSGITKIAIKALEITRFNIKIFVVIFLKCLFLQITNTTEKFKMMDAAITKTNRTSCVMCEGVVIHSSLRFRSAISTQYAVG